MWKRIEESVCRATGSIVYSIWGSVGIDLDYQEQSKEIVLIVYDKSYKCSDKNEVVNQRFKCDLGAMDEYKAKHDIISMIEKYLLENHS